MLVDQLFHDLEKRFIKLQKEFTLLRSQKDVLINENKELGTFIDFLRLPLLPLLTSVPLLSYSILPMQPVLIPA